MSGRASDAGSVSGASTVSEIWSRRVLDAGELLAAAQEAVDALPSATPDPSPSPTPPLLSSNTSRSSATPTPRPPRPLPPPPPPKPPQSARPRPRAPEPRRPPHRSHSARAPADEAGRARGSRRTRSPTILYQGETFVLHEIQFLI